MRERCTSRSRTGSGSAASDRRRARTPRRDASRRALRAASATRRSDRSGSAFSDNGLRSCPMRRGYPWLFGLPILMLGCNSLLGIDEANEVGSSKDASTGGAAGTTTGGAAGTASGGAPGGGGVPSGGSAGIASGGVGGVPSGGGSAGTPSGGGTGGGVPCSGEACAFDKIQCCQSTNVSSALAVGNSITSEVCNADQFTCAVCRQGGGACSAFCQGVSSEFAVCLECVIEECSGLYLGVKGACGSACSDFDACMAGCGS